jgi:hypothetical protein
MLQHGNPPRAAAHKNPHHGLYTGSAGPGRDHRLTAGHHLVLLAAFLLLALVACDRSAQDRGQDATATPRPARTNTVGTAADTPTTAAVVRATATIASLPTATLTPPPYPPPTRSSTSPCEHDYFFTPAPAPCPEGPPIETAAAEEPFTGGVMIWLQVTDSIYVFYPDGQYQRFEDTWTEDQPESDPTLTPPEDDLYQPIRGFGKVWREHPEVREALGWATSVELGFLRSEQGIRSLPIRRGRLAY